MKTNLSLLPKLKPLLYHGMVWAIIASLVFFSHPPVASAGPFARFEERLTWLQLISLISLILLFYVNTLWLIPAFFQRRKMLIFVLIQVAIGAILITVQNVFFDHLVHDIYIPPMRLPALPGGGEGNESPMVFRLPLGVPILPVLLTISASLAYRYILDSLNESHQRKERQMANLTSELQLLKSQVSPHFLFNVLNGLAFLARKRSESLEPALIKLSSLMRYMIYDAEGFQVLLKKEINYLNDYIDLQKMRYQELRINVFFHEDGSRLLIAPMILIPFVENAFKHAAGFTDERGFIKIELLTEKNTVYFSVVNRFNDSKSLVLDKASGIGLSNVGKRLQLIYPGKHTLVVERVKDIYTVALMIELEAAAQGA